MLIQLADNALSTLERVKLMLGVSEQEDALTKIKEALGIQDSSEPEESEPAEDQPSREDLILTMLINRASAEIESQIGHHLGKADYDQWYYADGRRELVLKEYPIVSVESIAQDGETVAPEEYDAVQRGNIGVVYKDDGWLHSGYYHGLANDMLAKKRCIRVKYTAGYVLPKDATEDDPQTLPADLEGLLWEMVQYAYANLKNGADGLTSFSISDVSWSFDKENSTSWTSILNRYRRY